MVKPSPAQRTPGAFLKQELKLGSWRSNMKRQMGQTPRSAPVYATHNTCDAFCVNRSCNVSAIIASASTDRDARNQPLAPPEERGACSNCAKSSRSCLRACRRPFDLRFGHGDHVRGDKRLSRCSQCRCDSDLHQVT